MRGAATIALLICSAAAALGQPPRCGQLTCSGDVLVLSEDLVVGAETGRAICRQWGSPAEPDLCEMAPAATAPALRPDGSALQAGDTYFDTAAGAVFIRGASSWLPAHVRWLGTLGAETADVIPWDLQAIGYTDSVTVAAVFLVRVTVLDTAGAEAAAFTLSDGGAGTIFVGAGTSSIRASTDATGLLELDVTDTVGASGATLWLDVESVGPSTSMRNVPVGGHLQVCTFDGV